MDRNIDWQVNWKLHFHAQLSFQHIGIAFGLVRHCRSRTNPFANLPIIMNETSDTYTPPLGTSTCLASTGEGTQPISAREPQFIKNNEIPQTNIGGGICCFRIKEDTIKQAKTSSHTPHPFPSPLLSFLYITICSSCICSEFAHLPFMKGKKPKNKVQ